MKKFGFYLLGKKGYQCLARFIEKYDKEAVAFVVLSRDKGVKNDYFDEIAEFCGQNGLDLYDRSERISAECDVSFAIGWRWMIRDNGTLIVFHDSLLPKYRGFSPLVNMLISGEKKIGVTALFASQDYDSGDIIEQEAVEIKYPIKISEAIDTVSNLYEIVLLKIAECIYSGTQLRAISQDASITTFSLWRDESDYEINWDRDAEGVKRLVDAVGYPYAGAKTKLHGEWVRVLDVELIKDVEVESREEHLGKVIFMDERGPTVVCGRGLVKLITVCGADGRTFIRNISFRTRFGV